jgi:uncharacterized protein (DUF433 family)
MTPAQIVEELPDLEEEHIRQAPAYAAARLAGASGIKTPTRGAFPK